jgi:hypothetical protein
MASEAKWSIVKYMQLSGTCTLYTVYHTRNCTNIMLVPSVNNYVILVQAHEKHVNVVPYYSNYVSTLVDYSRVFRTIY